MGQPYLSEIRIFSFGFPPKGWALCNGQVLPINQNQALFALLGTTYGGNGTTTFALPNLQGRVPMHMGGGFSLGQRGGEETHTLLMSEMPLHGHQLNVTAVAATLSNPTGALLATTSSGYASTPNTSLYSGSITTVGGSQPHENRQPFLSLNICIAITGIFPSRN